MRNVHDSIRRALLRDEAPLSKAGQLRLQCLQLQAYWDRPVTMKRTSLARANLVAHEYQCVAMSMID